MSTAEGQRVLRRPDIDAPVVVVLDGAGAPASLVGGKAAALDRLVGWGLPVPATAVVTTAAYRSTITDPHVAEVLAQITAGEAVPAAVIDGAFARSTMDDEIRAQLVAVARRVAGGGFLAVRSSASVEDLDGSSFAGQYRSVLDVDPADAERLVAAVTSVFASLHHPAPRAYRTAVGLTEDGVSMAVVLMPMVHAVRAGVVFTQDPTGRPEVMRIEHVDGLADALVSGRRTPTVVLVERATAGEGLAPEIRQVYDLALRVERLTDRPQDIEWAWDGGRVWLVQARPITVVRSAAGRRARDAPRAVPADPELTTAGIAEMMPGALPPLVWELLSFVVDEAFRHTFEALGSRDPSTDPRSLLRCVRGRAALDVERLGQAMEGVAGGAARIRSEYFGDDDADDVGLRPRSHRVPSPEMARHLARAATLRHRATLDAEIVIQAAAALGDEPLPALDDAELLARQVRLVDLAVRAMAAELTVAADAHAISEGLRSSLSRYLAPRLAARHLLALTVPDEPLTPLVDDSAAVFAGPTWSEIGIVPREPDRRSDGSPDTTREALARDLRQSSRWPRSAVGRWLASRRLERLATEASRQLDRRDRTKSAVLRIGGHVRRVHLELGARLVTRGGLERATDVDLLTVRELRRTVGSNGSVSLAEVRRRRVRHERQVADPPLPLHLGGTVDHRLARAPVGRQLEGWAASGGCFTGTARRADGPEAVVASDEVLVAVSTDPSWSPLLMRCGALIIEQGGPLSHAAILAREFGVPAVFNLPGASRSLDGRRVTVDGDLGLVTILDDEVGS